MHSIINLQDYTMPEVILFALGCLCWVIVYLIVIKNIRKHNFVEVPAVAVCANFAWEALWSWSYTTDMGLLFVWGYRIWFFLDVFIVISLFRYGYKQVINDQLRDKFIPYTIFGMVCWFGGLYFFIGEYGNPMGATSGYILNVMMSALYIMLFLNRDSIEGFSFTAGILKGVGTALISIFCFMRWSDDPFLLVLCVATFVLDALYIYYFSQRRKAEMVGAV
jgi:hypothetical protein